MKKVRTINFDNKELTVLATVDAEKKASIEYFLNGRQVTNWSSLSTVQQKLFTIIADEICDNYGLTKWTY